MRRFFTLLLVMPGFLWSLSGSSADAHHHFYKISLIDTLPSGDSVVVTRLLQKMTDTLGLTSDQQQQIGALSYWIDSCKLSVLQQYDSQPDSLGYLLLQVERSRDSCYAGVLTETQYRTYGQKKTVLVLNN